MKKSTLAEIIAIWFVILFLYAAICKIVDFTVFRIQIGQSPVLKPVAWWIAWLTPVIEFVVSILLFLPKTRLKGLRGAFGLMTAFTLYVIAIMTLDASLPCSCGGVIEKLSWKGHLIFNSINTVLALTGVQLEWSAKKHPTHTIAIG